MDMTPMVDLAFLLVTFFMLTASFREAEPVVEQLLGEDGEKAPPPPGGVAIGPRRRALRRKRASRGGVGCGGGVRGRRSDASLMAGLAIEVD
jgi:hypothetical protein